MGKFRGGIRGRRFPQGRARGGFVDNRNRSNPNRRRINGPSNGYGQNRPSFRRARNFIPIQKRGMRNPRRGRGNGNGTNKEDRLDKELNNYFSKNEDACTAIIII